MFFQQFGSEPHRHYRYSSIASRQCCAFVSALIYLLRLNSLIIAASVQLLSLLLLFLNQNFYFFFTCFMLLFPLPPSSLPSACPVLPRHSSIALRPLFSLSCRLQLCASFLCSLLVRYRYRSSLSVSHVCMKAASHAGCSSVHCIRAITSHFPLRHFSTSEFTRMLKRLLYSFLQVMNACDRLCLCVSVCVV